MKKSTIISLSILLSLMWFSFPLFGAENWVKYEEDKTAESYIDVSSIRTIGNITSYRDLINFRQRVTTMSSTIMQHEIKCSEKNYRFLKMTSYSEHFGRGGVVGIVTPTDMGLGSSKFYSIESGFYNQYKFICNLKK